MIPAGGRNRRSMLVSWLQDHQAPQAPSAVSLPGGRRAVIPAGGGNRFSTLDSPPQRQTDRVPRLKRSAGPGHTVFYFPARAPRDARRVAAGARRAGW